MEVMAVAGDFGKMMADYIKEKQGCETIFTDEGFVVYMVKDNDILHINNIYIKPEFRKTKRASALMSKVIDEVCPKTNSTMITASCDHAQLNPETSMQGILGYKHTKGYRFRILPEVKQTNFFMELI